MKKRLLIVIPSLGLGGGEKLAMDVVKHLDQSKFEIVVVSLFSLKSKIIEQVLIKSDVKIIYLNKQLGLDLRVIIELIKIVKRFKPDILHTHLGVIPHVLPAIFLIKIKKKYHTVHSIASKEARGINKYLMIISFKFLNFKPIAISEYIRKTIITEFDIPKNKIVVINNGVDLSKYYPNKLESNKRSFIFITAGRLQKVKNHEFMINAMAELIKIHSNVRLVILGDGELREKLERQIKLLNLSSYVVLKGAIQNVEDELRKADVYLMSSKYEGLPLSIIEAMSTGLPVITTKAGGVVDIVKDEQNGYIIENENFERYVESMVTLIEDETKRKLFSDNAIETSRSFNLQDCVNAYEELYIE